MADAEDSSVSEPASAPPRVPRWERFAALGLFGLVAVSCEMWVNRPNPTLDFFYPDAPTALARGATAFLEAVPTGLGALHDNRDVVNGAGCACFSAFIPGTVVMLPLSLLAALGKGGGRLRRGLWWLAACHAALVPTGMVLLGRAFSITFRWSEPLRWHHGWLDDFTFANGALKPLLVLTSLAQFLLAAAVLWFTRSREKASAPLPG
jgi:hypothetical protein